MATATGNATTFEVTCPHCHAEEASLEISLNDLGTVLCRDCDEEFSPQQAIDVAVEQLKRWRAVARWVTLAGECLKGEDA